jgi:outer membrane immunogenic protein
MFRKFSMASAVLMVATGSALAADLPSRREPPVYIPPPPLFTWTGVYVGGQIGYGWANNSISSTLGGFSSSSTGGVVGGAHIGYNYQINQFVVGLEGDVDGTSIRKSASTSFPIFASASSSLPIEGSVRGRIGYAWDRALFYATGGAAFADIKNSANVLGITSSTSTGRVGWTVGGGIEYALTNNWSVRGEYRYSDFGRTSALVPTTPPVGFSNHLTEHAVRVGFSYKFDMYAPPAPVLAKY